MHQLDELGLRHKGGLRAGVPNEDVRSPFGVRSLPVRSFPPSVSGGKRLSNGVAIDVQEWKEH